MPPSENLLIRVVLTVEVDGHVLTFEETGTASGARYHGADPRKSGRSGWGSLESRIRGGVDIHMALVAERARVYLARAYPTADDAPAPAAAQPAEPIDWGTCLACGESEENCRVVVECCEECATAGFRAMHVPAAQLLTPPPAEPAPAPMSSVRAALHALAPLPWAADADGDIFDARGKRQFSELTGAWPVPGLRGELVARVVNEPEPATAPAADERTRAVDEVLAAARQILLIQTPIQRQRAIARILDALDALDGPGGAS